MKTGLFFGSFNPVHNGHLAIAEYMLAHTDLEEIWFVVSPLNPWKEESHLPHSSVRLEMVKLAIQHNKHLKATNFEENLPRPSYTYEALQFLITQYPDRAFYLLIGGDNLEHFHKWRNHRKILANVKVMAYPRKGHTFRDTYKNIQLIEAPILEISSTQIREAFKKPDIPTLPIHKNVLNYILTNNLYTNA